MAQLFKWAIVEKDLLLLFSHPCFCRGGCFLSRFLLNPSSFLIHKEAERILSPEKKTLTMLAQGCCPTVIEGNMHQGCWLLWSASTWPLSDFCKRKGPAYGRSQRAPNGFREMGGCSVPERILLPHAEKSARDLSGRRGTQLPGRGVAGLFQKILTDLPQFGGEVHIVGVGILKTLNLVPQGV